MDKVEVMAMLRDIPIPEHLSRMTEFGLLDEVSDSMISDYEKELQARHDDLLITTATEEGIARRERILGILPDPDDSLEVRRSTVLFWWYNRMPYTRRVLESKVAALCGKGNYTFDYDPVEETIHVGISASLGWDVIDIVRSLLDRLVMLNVILDVKAIAVEVIDTTIYLGAVEQRYQSVEMIPDNADVMTQVDDTLYIGIHHWEWRKEGL